MDKICVKCRKSKSNSDFYASESTAKWCKDCHRKSSQNYYRCNSERVKQHKRELYTYEKQLAKHLKHAFNGMTVQEYMDLVDKQEGVCLICGDPPKARRLCVDHNHKTGEIRGLLCTFCNCLTGFVEKYPEHIRKIKLYLGRS